MYVIRRKRRSPLHTKWDTPPLVRRGLLGERRVASRRSVPQPGRLAERSGNLAEACYLDRHCVSRCRRRPEEGEAIAAQAKTGDLRLMRDRAWLAGIAVLVLGLAFLAVRERPGPHTYRVRWTSVDVSSDGRSLVVHYPPQCYPASADVAESATAVTIELHSMRINSPTNCTAPEPVGRAFVHLARPLGDRRLLR